MKAKKPTIVVAGILDTKGNEIKFLAEQVRKAGGNPIIMEISCGGEVGWADIPVSELISKEGYTKDDIFKLDRIKAADIIAKGGIKKVKEMLEEGKLDGIIAHGGATSTFIGSKIMQSLPLGVPKIMSSTLATGDCRPYIGTRDIAMFYPIVEMGLNKVTRKVLTNAAAMIVGGSMAPSVEKEEIKPLIGCTILGVVAPCTERASRHFESRGYDLINLHAVGGGASLEELIRDGEIVGSLDIATHEMTDLACGGEMHAGPSRLSAAGEMGIPQVVSTGGLDFLGPGGNRSQIIERKLRSKVTGGLFEEEEKKFQGRSIVNRTPNAAAVGILPEEAQKVAEAMVTRLNKVKGPTVLVVPMQGWGEYDISEEMARTNPSLTKGKGPGPYWDGGSTVNPNWSKRAVAFVEVVKKLVDKSNPNLDVLICDRHINEPEFANLLITIFDEMLRGVWKKGMHRDKDKVESYIPE